MAPRRVPEGDRVSEVSDGVAHDVIGGFYGRIWGGDLCGLSLGIVGISSDDVGVLCPCAVGFFGIGESIDSILPKSDGSRSGLLVGFGRGGCIGSGGRRLGSPPLVVSMVWGR